MNFKIVNAENDIVNRKFCRLRNSSQNLKTSVNLTKTTRKLQCHFD